MREEQDLFAKAENIRNYRRKLETETDPDKRRILMQLLDQEKVAAPDGHGKDD